MPVLPELSASDICVSVGGSVTGILAAAFYAFYRNRSRVASQIKNATTVKIGPELKESLQNIPEQSISYAAVEGFVTEIGKVFHTENSPKEGVILRSSMVEHKSRNINGTWSDSRKVWKDDIGTAPFALSDPDELGHMLHVSDAMEAQCLLDSLEVTHQEFQPVKNSILQAGLDLVRREISRGYEVKEEMLVIGTQLLGIGEIILQDKKLQLRPPQSKAGVYYLTTMTRTQLMKQFQMQAIIFKKFAIIFGIIATGLMAFMVWKLTKKYQSRIVQREIEEHQQQALRRRAQAREEMAREEYRSCVVCIDNPREVVALNCGHISMCVDCAEALPTPLRCPVCRQHIDRFMPIYLP